MPSNKNYHNNDEDDWLNSDPVTSTDEDELSPSLRMDSNASEASIDMDSLLDVESNAYKKGFEKGRLDAKEIYYKEGQDFGRRQGLEVGFQFGQYLRNGFNGNKDDFDTLYDWIAGRHVKTVKDGDAYIEWGEKVRSKVKVQELRGKRKGKRPALKVENDTFDF